MARTAQAAVAVLVVALLGRVVGAAWSADPGAEIVTPAALRVAHWNPDTDNLVPVVGTVDVGGRPVAGVRVRVGSYAVPEPTNAAGQFVYFVDHTLLGRHVVTVSDASAATVGGVRLSKAQEAALQSLAPSIDVAYSVRGLKASRDGAGHPVVSGELVDVAGGAPPAVGLLTYQLTGTVVDADGKPVAGAQVSTRTLDRDYWTVSSPTDANGRYGSLFNASSEASENPVPFTVRVAVGNTVYQFLPGEFVRFERLKSATLDIRLPPPGYAMAIPRPESYPGAVYTGVVAGLARGGTSIRPLSLTWPDQRGRFRIVLPRAYCGSTLSLFEAKLALFSRQRAQAGGPIALDEWPRTLPADAPRDVATIHIPR